MSMDLATVRVQHPPSVLVADDEKSLRDLYRHALESQGYVVAMAADGQSALDIFRQAKAQGRPFDVVLLDLCMPGLDGLECAQAMLGDDPWAQIIIATGTCDADLGDMAGRMAAVLIKPTSLKTLLREVSSCLETPSQAPG